MYRRVLPLLLAAALVLSGCTANQKAYAAGKRKHRIWKRAGQSSDTSGEGEHVYGYHGTCHISGGRLLLGHGTADAVHSRRHRRRERLCQRHLRGGRGLSRPSARASTGFRETVRVEYDPEQVSLDALLLAYFYVIDPTVENRQGNDRRQPVPDRCLLHQRQARGRRWSASRRLSGDAARNSSWRSAHSRTTTPPRSTTRTTSKRTRTATATSRGRRWSCSPSFASIQATTKSPQQSPFGTN